MLSFLGPGAFILLHAAQCRPKNTTSIIIANLLSIAIGTTVFWACGYAFAMGDGTTESSNFFLAHKRFFLIEGTLMDYQKFVGEILVLWYVLVLGNGGFASRMRYWLYPIVTLFIAGFIYPCVRHWTNHMEGWLKDGIDIDRDGTTINLKFVDHFGAGSIHVFAGSVALLGTILLAPRKERKGRSFKSVGGQLTPLMLVGGFIAFVSLLNINTNNSLSIWALANNILAAQASAGIAFAVKRMGFFGTRSGTKALLNGALAGLVSCACMGDTFHAYGGFVVGVIGGLAYVGWSALLQLCHVDDPTDVIAVHLGGGLWALLAGPIFKRDDGILYSGSRESFELFGWHLLAALAIFVWAGLLMFIVLIVFVCSGISKYKSPEATETGLDAYEHKEPAYPDRDHYTQDEVVEAGSLDAIIQRPPSKSYNNSGFYDYKLRASNDNLNRQQSQEYPERTWNNQQQPY